MQSALEFEADVHAVWEIIKISRFTTTLWHGKPGMKHLLIYTEEPQCLYLYQMITIPKKVGNGHTVNDFNNTDFSKYSYEAIKKILNISRLYKTEIFCLHVIDR